MDRSVKRRESHREEGLDVREVPRDEFRQNIDLFAGRPFTAEEARQALRAADACVTYRDRHLGRLLDKLDPPGLRKNTIIVFRVVPGGHFRHRGMRP